MKILLITGASSDIGLELIRSIANDYDRIIAHYAHSPLSINAMKEELGDKLILVKADFLNETSTREFAAFLTEADMLPTHIIHISAAKFEYKNFQKTDWSLFKASLDVSVRSIQIILQSVLPLMAKKGDGHIVFILSSCTLNDPPKYLSSYVTTKYALLGLMKSLSVEYADKGISINSISPEMVETKFLSSVPRLIIDKARAENPRKRLLSVTDVVSLVSFLFSDAACSITTQNIGITDGK